MKTNYYVRFDDICPTMSYSQFFKAIELMKKNGINPLLGIIPCNEDGSQFIDSPREDFWEIIRKLKDDGFVVAMHGCTHVYSESKQKTIICGRKHSEFAGRSYEEQLSLIKRGKECLEKHGIFTDVFFAPGHSYDKNTLKALKTAGFNYISDGMSNKPYYQCGIKCLPCKSFGVSQRIKGINVAVNHPNEWLLKEKEHDYDKLVDYCSNNVVGNFDDLLKKKPGLFLIQKGIEKINIFIHFFVKPALNKFRKK